MELLRSCTKPSIYFFLLFHDELFLLFLNLKLENYSVFTFLLFLDLKLEYYSVFTFLLFLDLQDCSNSSELAMGLLQSCTKPSISFFFTFSRRIFLLFLNLKLENYSVFTFLLFLDLKLENYSLFTFLLFLDLKLENYSIFTFSQTEVGKLLLIYLFTFSRKSSLIYPFKEIIVFLVCQFQSMGICNR